MNPPTVSHVGKGKPARVMKELRRERPGMTITFRTDDISQPTDWRIYEPRHAIVIHLGGVMRQLETELSGFGGSRGTALPGEVWTVPGGHRYASHACGDQIHYAVLLFDPARLNLEDDSQQELVALAGVRDELLHHAMKELRQATSEDDDHSQMIADSLIQSLQHHLCRQYLNSPPLPKNGPSGPRLNDRTARRLRDYIFDNLSERLSLADLSQIAGMTTHHLLIAFRKAFGTTPAQYIIRERLRSAQRQLATTKKDITTIALDSGFSSHSHLTFCFRQHIGCSPRQFRNQSMTPELSDY